MQVYAAPPEIPAPDFGTFFTAGKFDNEACAAAEEKYIADVQKWALENGEPHDVAGKVIAVPYADGQAMYVPFKRGTRVSLIHLAVGDAWRDDRFERLATVAELRRIVARRAAMAELFGKRKATS